MKKAGFIIASTINLIPFAMLLLFLVVNPKLPVLFGRDKVKEEIAIKYITAFFNKDLEELKELSNPDEFEVAFLPQLKNLYAHSDMKKMDRYDLIDSGINKNNEAIICHYYYEIESNSKLFIIKIDIKTKGNLNYIENMSIEPISSHAMHLGRLTNYLANKNVIAILIFAIIATYICQLSINYVWKDISNKKWLWYLLSLITFPAFSINKANGTILFSLLSIHLPALNLSRQGNIGLWQITTGLPIIAIIIVVKKLIHQYRLKEANRNPTT